jgi:hypothetical protein
MRLLIGMAAVVLALSLGLGAALASEVVSKIQKIDTDQKMVMLEDGTELWLQDDVAAGDLKEGVKVKVAYAERDGKKWVEKVEIVTE